MHSKESEELPAALRALREKGDGFVSPPDAYFAQLAQETVARVHRPAVVRTWRSATWAVAASLLLLLGLWLALDRDFRGEGTTTPMAQATPSSAELLADIPPEAIEEYIGSRLSEFETELYAAQPPNE
ncbi:hypothetical protein QWY85_08090 [Neolewinella lacunae]|uniref:DUF3619 family protein n=1 Tax=Neolewinella lacunae TaxID=1517758 RepID=A0A923T8Q8_9BACT|nr:hypothetical protein [Neolewinella lacunae]MBC6994228.1 hypothetical protein [Neolewinella lacunae]MDN3634613.1 hypothetical protein [Neolewinella lacunae]